MLLIGLACITTVGCTDSDGEMFNCLLAPDVPAIVIKEQSASEANKKCEQEQGQACTCTPVRPYNSITGPL